MRAAGAKAGIYGNDADRSDLPADARATLTARPLDGSKHNYTLTFASGQFPPVNAFWSVTMYDGKTPAPDREPDQPLPDQLADAAGHEEERRRLVDDLHPEGQSPGEEKESNWLPAPDGPIYLVMRLYWPKTEAPSVLPAGEGTWKPPGIVKLKLTSLQLSNAQATPRGRIV